MNGVRKDKTLCGHKSTGICSLIQSYSVKVGTDLVYDERDGDTWIHVRITEYGTGKELFSLVRRESELKAEKVSPKGDA